VIVVSNTSPIINLAAIGQLNLLEQLYGRIVIPQGVYHEIVIVGAGQAGAAEVQTSAWIESRQVVSQGLVTSLLTNLDKGEAEAIALALDDLRAKAGFRISPQLYAQVLHAAGE